MRAPCWAGRWAPADGRGAGIAAQSLPQSLPAAVRWGPRRWGAGALRPRWAAPARSRGAWPGGSPCSSEEGTAISSYNTPSRPHRARGASHSLVPELRGGAGACPYRGVCCRAHGEAHILGSASQGSS